ncbi:hypothetical protein NUM_46130 [Actinocatenispora comari]|uniref:Uncharacterized protein n=1 Tax=Actinocatenispora comari TaxID=2807577 RepID=A0A8J4AEY5_9ACTN|nr:hypothetical protein NUM_46130 [Actinocatenispora comari]
METSSASVTGSAGTSDFFDSAPVGATVINVPPIPAILPDLSGSLRRPDLCSDGDVRSPKRAESDSFAGKAEEAPCANAHKPTTTPPAGESGRRSDPDGYRSGSMAALASPTRSVASAGTFCLTRARVTGPNS